MSDYQGPCECLKSAEEIVYLCMELQTWALRLLQRHPALDQEIIDTLTLYLSGICSDSEAIEPVVQFARDLEGRSGEDYEMTLRSLPMKDSKCEADPHVDIAISYHQYL